MTRQQLEISKIIVLDRQRNLNLSHVSSLADSMAALGLIQPIVINQDNRLIAGGHRLAAAIKLGWTHIDVCYRETMSEAELQELELTENLKRSDLLWQERVIAVAKIHDLKKRSAAIDSKTWGQKETGDLLGITQGYVSYAIVISRVLLDKPHDSEIWKADSASDAWNIIMRWQTEDVEKDLATRHLTQKPVEPTISIKDAEELYDFTSPVVENQPEGRLVGYEPEIPPLELREPCVVCGGNDKRCEHCKGTGFDWKSDGGDHPTQICMRPVYQPYDQVVIDLTAHYIKGDSIQFMLANPERFDHIVTDIPYGIDIEMIDQHVGIKDIETIKAEHGVEDNLNLYRQFFPAAFKCLKPNAFLITWCDQMNWQFMYDLAIYAGFKVQCWPITWVKTHQCLNQMAQFNFTKSTEIAMVCRKGVITLVEKQSTSVIEAGRDELCDLINHPFAKPYACWERLITAVSIENQCLLDPFVGKGSSFLSGIQLGRNMYGCEIDEALYNGGLEVLKQFYLGLNPKTVFK